MLGIVAHQRNRVTTMSDGTSHDRAVILGAPVGPIEHAPQPPRAQTWAEVPWRTIVGAVGVVLGDLHPRSRSC